MSKPVHEVDACVDRDFVWELAKRGEVHVLTSQVTITGESINLAGIQIPKGCEIEYAGAREGSRGDRPVCQITFGWPNS